MDIIKHKYSILEGEIYKTPNKNAISFDDLYEVAISLSRKEDEATLKMLKAIYNACSHYKLIYILKDCFIKADGVKSTQVVISTETKEFIEKVFFTMIEQEQQTIDNYSKSNTSLARDSIKRNFL